MKFLRGHEIGDGHRARLRGTRINYVRATLKSDEFPHSLPFRRRAIFRSLRFFIIFLN